jgi:excisionase family DNA binding protein
MSIEIGGLVLYDIEELAEKLGVGTRYVRKLISEGELKGKKFAKKWFVSEQSLQDYFSRSDEPEKRKPL